MFSSPLRKSPALSAVSHKTNSPLGLHSGQWCVDLQHSMYETISSLYLEERTLSLEEGSSVLFLFQWCWERQGHCIPRCVGKEGLCLCRRLQTHRTSSSTVGWGPYSPPFISYWIQWHEGLETRWRADHIRARPTKISTLWNGEDWKRLNYVCSLLFTMKWKKWMEQKSFLIRDPHEA